jgi:ribosomal protein L34
MHYHHKLSKISRIRKSGFRARMKTGRGRRLINRARRVGRRVGLD